MTKRLIIVAFALLSVFEGMFAWKHHRNQQIAESAANPPPPAMVTVARRKVKA